MRNVYIIKDKRRNVFKMAENVLVGRKGHRKAQRNILGYGDSVEALTHQFAYGYDIASKTVEEH